MKRFLKAILLLSLLLTVLAVAGGFAIWHELVAQPGISVSVNGEDLGLHELHAMHWSGLLFGGLVTALVLLVVLPLALVLGLGLPLLIVASLLGVALLAMVGVGGLLLSPLLLAGLLLWVLLRRRKTPEKPQGAAAAQP
ncbi:hypothetical protein G8A07_03255 [Roseateles sp. DAIF2]|uniref:hypothetical protein n=1 Tax=Roseateles sp. DAIF2 TaxID=2714952 RepID=UPI0018A24AD1|nr:hypothetical protein [Roseateles sp. DAIF2]QPF72045.1 hypothetical protein G8A07_03255 [Roseateles sp. DAIF2]